jgi:hypothetical protein
MLSLAKAFAESKDPCNAIIGTEVSGNSTRAPNSRENALTDHCHPKFCMGSSTAPNLRFAKIRLRSG